MSSSTTETSAVITLITQLNNTTTNTIQSINRQNVELGSLAHKMMNENENLMSILKMLLEKEKETQKQQVHEISRKRTYNQVATVTLEPSSKKVCNDVHDEKTVVAILSLMHYTSDAGPVVKCVDETGLCTIFNHAILAYLKMF